MNTGLGNGTIRKYLNVKHFHDSGCKDKTGLDSGLEYILNSKIEFVSTNP